MSLRTLKIQMKKGRAIIKEVTEIPLKEDALLRTAEYTFYCNPSTFDKLARLNNLEDAAEANKKLERYFLHEVIGAPDLQQFCFDFDGAMDALKADLILGEGSDAGAYGEHWQLERDENVLRALRQDVLGKRGLQKLEIYTDPNNFYKAMVDLENGTVEFVQFDEVFSALKQKNVLAETISIRKRPMYIVHKLLTLITYIREKTGNETWGE